MASPRIAFLGHPFDWIEPPHATAMSIVTHELVRRLRDGAQVAVVSPGRYRTRREERDGVPYLRVPRAFDRMRFRLRGRLGLDPGSRLTGEAPFRGWLEGATRAAAGMRPDVVHVQNFPQILPRLRQALPEAKLVLHMHSRWLADLPADWSEPRVAAADLVLGVSEHVTEAQRRRLPALAGRFATLINGVDLERFHPARASEPPPRRPRVLFAGRVSPEKGVHVLVDAFARVLAGGSDAELVVAGPLAAATAELVLSDSADPVARRLAPHFRSDYPARVRASVPETARERVRFLGARPHAEIPGLLRGATVVALPSVWHEPCSLVLLEAMASGAPIVTTRSGGTPELVEHDRSALLVARDDADALAAALVALLADARRRRALGDAARRRAESRHAWDAVAATLRSHYVRLLANRGA